jgi:hypothetical protein
MAGFEYSCCLLLGSIDAGRRQNWHSRADYTKSVFISRTGFSIEIEVE